MRGSFPVPSVFNGDKAKNGYPPPPPLPRPSAMSLAKKKHFLDQFRKLPKAPDNLRNIRYLWKQMATTMLSDRQLANIIHDIGLAVCAHQHTFQGRTAKSYIHNNIGIWFDKALSLPKPFDGEERSAVLWSLSILDIDPNALIPPIRKPGVAPSTFRPI